jgi:carboxypeptidase Taq
MGLNINFSRLDLSEHSFTIRIGVDDVRITTNHRENDFLFSFFSTIHEAGHALYELGYPKDFKDTVIYDAASYGLHESQSRFWENMIARNKIFWENYFEIFQQEFDDLKEIDLDSWFFLINMSKKSKVRIEADEISYVLHIIIRYEIEKKLIEGNLKPCDVPKEWNKMYKELLDVDISNDSEGCLQDMHWSDGAIGYFPSYAIGTIYAVQIYNQMMSDDKIFDSFKSGKFDLILKSLRDNVHIHGKKYSAEEIITKFCKSGLNSKEYLKYLEEKYTKLYEI